MLPIIRIAVVSAVGALLDPGASWAFPGDLDPTFGSGGVVTMSSLPAGRALALQTDGKIIVVSDGIRATRFNPNGMPDPSFGSGGTIVAPIGSGAAGTAIALQSDGMIVVAGASGGQFALVRYDTNGVLDPLFGTGGVVLTPIQAAGGANGVVVQSTGAIVAAGFTSTASGSPDFALARYTAAGVLDATFGTGGTVITPITPSGTDIAYALLLGPGDKLVAAGTSPLGAVALRYDSEGVPDPTFGSGGLFTSAAEDFYSAVAASFQPDGNIVLAGNSAYLQLAAARATDSGTIDSGFGGNGVVITEFGGLSGARAVVVEPDGRVIAAGFDGTPGPGPTGGFSADFVLARYLGDGSLDGEFGIGGTVRTHLGMSETIAAAVLDGGALVVAGSQGSGSIFGGTHLVVARYLLGDACDAPISGCTAPTVARKSAFEAKEGTTNDRLQWKFRSGDATTLAEFGDPLTSARYVLCAYDESGVTPVLLGKTEIPAGGICSGKPCWTAIGTKGFKYRSKDRTPHGIGALTLLAGEAGKAKITLQGKGDLLPTLGLPLDLPVRVRLQTTTACWETVFSAAGVSKNDSTQFKGKSD